jgi:hypothetical protein
MVKYKLLLCFTFMIFIYEDILRPKFYSKAIKESRKVVGLNTDVFGALGAMS